jgi:hypothetical protein
MGGQMQARIFPLSDPTKHPGHSDTVTWQETVGPDGNIVAVPDYEIPTTGMVGRESAHYSRRAQAGYEAKLAIQQQSTALAAARGDTSARSSQMSRFAAEKQRYLDQSTRFQVLALSANRTEASTYGGELQVGPTDSGGLRYTCS